MKFRTTAKIGKEIRQAFPYMKRPAPVIATYVENLLNILDYLPKSRVEILQVIFAELCAIDVSFY